MARLRKTNQHYIVDKLQLPMTAEMELELGEALEIDVKLVDKRAMSDQQRKFIFALCRVFEYETGNDAEMFRGTVMQSATDNLGIEKTSLTEYTMTDANNLIKLIISTLIQLDIPISGELLRQNEYSWTYQQTYMMCLKRICVVCGRRADIHHVDAIGSKGNRKKISHIGMRALPLCRICHTTAHSKGNDFMINNYHLTPVVIDEKLEYFIKKGIIKEYD